MQIKWHIRYSAKTTALFSNLAEPRQHAVHNDTLKTFCGRDAREYFNMDDIADEKQITCEGCRKRFNKITNPIPL